MDKNSIFVSSTIRNLVDLRAVLKKKIEEKDYQPYLSEYPGFVPEDGVPSHAACLVNIKKSVRVIAVIDRVYGEPKDDWGVEYTPICKGLSPSHGEIVFTLKTDPNKLWLYVRDKVNDIYEIWVKDPCKNSRTFNKEMDLRVLVMLKDLYSIQNLWIKPFKNVVELSDLIESRFFSIQDQSLYPNIPITPENTVNLINSQITTTQNQEFAYNIFYVSPDLIKTVYGDNTEIDVYTGGSVVVQKQGSTDIVTNAISSLLEGSAHIEGTSSMNVEGEVQKAKDD